MAGLARRAAATTWLEVQASKQGVEVIEWVCDQIASGQATLVNMADRATRESGIEITRNVLTKALASLHPDYEQHLEAARKDAAHALVERQHEAVMDLDGGSSKEEIAAETLKMRSTQWVAERFNRNHFGQNVKVEHELGPGALHLAMLKEKSAQRALELRQLPLIAAPAEEESEHADPEDLL